MRSAVFFWRYFLFGASRSIEKELRNDMFAHLEKMDVEYYNEHKTLGDLMTRFTSDLNAIRMAIGPAVICVFDASVMTIMVISDDVLCQCEADTHCSHSNAFYFVWRDLLWKNHPSTLYRKTGSRV